MPTLKDDEAFSKELVRYHALGAGFFFLFEAQPRDVMVRCFVVVIIVFTCSEEDGEQLVGSSTG